MREVRHNKIRFNRVILVLRIILLIMYSLIVYANLPLLRVLSLDLLMLDFMKVFITVYLVFSLHRILRLIFTESLDIEIQAERIIVKNIITRRKQEFPHEKIKGYRVERFKWNIFKIAGVRSLMEFESGLVVIYSNNKALLHFKSFNYFGTRKIVKELEASDYERLLQGFRCFNKYNYRKI